MSGAEASAWRRIAAHPAFADCYDEDGPVLSDMLERLDELTGAELPGPVDLYVLRVASDSGAVALALPLTDDEAAAVDAVRRLVMPWALGSRVEIHMVSAQAPGEDNWVLDSARPVSRREVERAWSESRLALPPVFPSDAVADSMFGN